MEYSPVDVRRSMGPQLPIRAADLDDEHGELVAALSELPPKVAAIRLLDHARRLPDPATAPQTLFFHGDVVTRIASLLLAPYPFTTHPLLLGDLLSILEAAPLRHASLRREDFRAATARAAALLLAEYTVRREWDRVRPLGERYHSLLGLRHEWIHEAGAQSARDRLGHLIDEICRLPCCAGMCWPYHLRDQTDLGRDSVLTVLVDTESIPPEYREAYLAGLTVTVQTRKTKSPGPPIVKSQDERGEDLPLGDVLKEAVREAVDRTVSLLGPSARARVEERQLSVMVLFRTPAPVTEIDGRSVLLPLVLALAGQLGEQLNLSARLDPATGVVWTGDVDRHGNITSVAEIPLKCERVAWSRVKAFAYPDADHGVVRDTLAPFAHSVSPVPLAHVLDVGETPGLAMITRRPLVTRAGFELRRRVRPLGISGLAAVGLVLAGLGFAIPRLASWLDRGVATARLTVGGDCVELLNSYRRVLTRFPVVHSAGPTGPILGDVDGDGEPEVFFGTRWLDSPPGTLLCYDRRGRVRWSFVGGFQSDDRVRGEYEDWPNTFNTAGVYVRDIDHDGSTDVVAVFTHSPYSATQIVRLAWDGTYVSSFWHRGHCGVANTAGNDLAFDDIDADGFDEIIVAGTSNPCDRPVIFALDPRSFSGRGAACDGTDSIRTWQTYVVLGDAEEVRAALRMPRLHAFQVELGNWNGRHVITTGIWLDLGGELRGAFKYRLDRDLHVVDFYWGDWFAAWADSARSAGLLPPDWSLTQFGERMRRIEVIPGPQWLRESERRPRDTATMHQVSVRPSSS